MDLDKSIRKIKDFPKPGILFYDITSIFTDHAAFQHVIDRMEETYKNTQIDGVVAIESRGFLLGAPFALKKRIPLVLARKEGKLPGDTIAESYSLEYGNSIVEMHADAIDPGEKVVVIDDLIATGGTIGAAVNLVKKLGGEILECGFVVELPDLNGREKIKDQKIFAMCEFEGE